MSEDLARARAMATLPCLSSSRKKQKTNDQSGTSNLSRSNRPCLMGIKRASACVARSSTDQALLAERRREARGRAQQGAARGLAEDLPPRPLFAYRRPPSVTKPHVPPPRCVSWPLFYACLLPCAFPFPMSSRLTSFALLLASFLPRPCRLVAPLLASPRSLAPSFYLTRASTCRCPRWSVEHLVCSQGQYVAQPAENSAKARLEKAYGAGCHSRSSTCAGQASSRATAEARTSFSRPLGCRGCRPSAVKNQPASPSVPQDAR